MERGLLLDLTDHVRAAVLAGAPLGGGRSGDKRSVGGDPQFPLDEVAERAARDFVVSTGVRAAIYMEDEGYELLHPQPDWLFVIDPIDGTRPATAGVDGGTVSVAVAPFGHDLALDDVAFAAVRELTNGRALAAERDDLEVHADGFPVAMPRLRTTTDIERMFWCLEFNGHPARRMIDAYGHVIDQSANTGGVFVVNSASFSITRIVTGQLDAYVDIGNRLYRDDPASQDDFLRVGGGSVLHLFPYDIAAAVLIAKTAGVILTDAYGDDLGTTRLVDIEPGNQRSCVAACTAALHERLLSEITWPSPRAIAHEESTR